jgi:hypothetical protein
MDKRIILKVDFKQILCETVVGIQLVKIRVNWQVLINMAVNIRIQ